MKKNIMMRIASVLMIAVLLTTCVISGTFAKYVSEVTATTSVKVASWDVVFGNLTEDPETHNYSFNFFDTLIDTASLNGEAETDVDTSEKLIAPGTKGSFTFNITNNSEVTAKIEIVIKNLPAALTQKIDFSSDNATITLDGTTLTVTAFNLAAKSSVKPVTIDWEWAYETGDDDADKALAGQEFNTVTATITATQVD